VATAINQFNVIKVFADLVAGGAVIVSEEGNVTEFNKITKLDC
jgi:hypothetical protein